jgi:hypothetical protein
LTVFQDPALHVLEDPKDKRNELFLMTTDNSNTQFAILALWTAQRYDVPMNRTLNLIVRRFLTSQNLNGSWDYDYHPGGNVQGKSTSSPAMTCVGLIGLAVGHGLAQPAAGQLVQDPRILRGLIALYLTIGKPSNPPLKTKPPMQNLYFLWSVERVAVLYNLPKIGDKDWYRWGAQVLVANQEAQGNWSGGGYPGSSPTLDTCLALLFLKRANLVKDLAAKLPFKAADLNHGIMDKQKPPPPPSVTKTTAKPTESPESLNKSIVAAKPSKQEAAENLLGKPLQGTASAGAADEDSAPANGSKRKWIVLAILIFVLFAGGSVLVLFAARRRGAEEEEKPDKPKKPKKKRKPQAKMSERAG